MYVFSLCVYFFQSTTEPKCYNNFLFHLNGFVHKLFYILSMIIYTNTPNPFSICLTYFRQSMIIQAQKMSRYLHSFLFSHSYTIQHIHSTCIHTQSFDYLYNSLTYTHTQNELVSTLYYIHFYTIYLLIYPSHSWSHSYEASHT